MTVNGSGNAKRETRSTRLSAPSAAMPSSRSSTIGLDPWPQRLDAPRREGARDQPAQPGVIRRIDGEHVPGERGSGKALGHDGRIRGHGGVHVLRQPRVVERGAGLVVVDDEPGIVAVGERHRVNRAAPAHVGEQFKRVVAMVRSPRLPSPRRRRVRSIPSELSHIGCEQLERGSALTWRARAADTSAPRKSGAACDGEHLPVAGNALEGVAAPVVERDAAAGNEVAHSRRHVDLAGTRERRDPCADVHGDARDVVAAQHALADVQPGPDLEIELDGLRRRSPGRTGSHGQDRRNGRAHRRRCVLTMTPRCRSISAVGRTIVRVEQLTPAPVAELRSTAAWSRRCR